MSTQTQDRHRRQLCRSIAAALIRGMADTDTSMAEIASRLGVPEADVIGRMATLIAGNSIGLNFISDFAFAMGCGLHIAIGPRADSAAEEAAA